VSSRSVSRSSQMTYSSSTPCCWAKMISSPVAGDQRDQLCSDWPKLAFDGVEAVFGIRVCAGNDAANAGIG
jgi:hypothetical protein